MTRQRIMEGTKPAVTESIYKAMIVLKRHGATSDELKAQVEIMVCEWLEECQRVAGLVANELGGMAKNSKG